MVLDQYWHWSTVSVPVRSLRTLRNVNHPRLPWDPQQPRGCEYGHWSDHDRVGHVLSAYRRNDLLLPRCRVVDSSPANQDCCPGKSGIQRCCNHLQRSDAIHVEPWRVGLGMSFRRMDFPDSANISDRATTPASSGQAPAFCRSSTHTSGSQSPEDELMLSWTSSLNAACLHETSQRPKSTPLTSTSKVARSRRSRRRLSTGRDR